MSSSSSSKWTKIRNSICATCLSRDRKLFPLRELKQLPMFFQYIPLSKKEDKVCWECKASIMKMISFQEKVLKAQALLSKVFDGSKQEQVLQSLSTLSTTTKDSYDETIQDDNAAKFVFYFTEVKLEDQAEEIERPATMDDSDSETESETEFKDFREKLEVKDEETVKVEAPSLEVPHNKDVERLDRDIDSDSEFTQYCKIRMQEKYVATKSGTEKVYKVVEGNATVDAYKTKPVTEEDLLLLMERKRSNCNFKNSRLKCVSCVEGFNSQRKYDDHMNSKHITRKLKCRICEQTFSSQKHLDEHAKIHAKSFVCCVCGSEHFQEFAMWNHYETRHELVPKYCKQCNERLPTVKALRKHKRDVHSPLVTCDVCSLQFKGKPSLEQHMMRHMGRRNKVECMECHKLYTGMSCLRAHMKRQHSKTNNKEMEAAYCPECDVQFKDRGLYKAHLAYTLKHNPSQNFKHRCEQCNKGFISKGILLYHLESVHSDLKKYDCEMCKQAFKTKRCLRKHVREKHEGKPKPKNQICEVCGKGFISKGQLAQHMNSHTGARPFVCTTCGATFGHSGALYTHNRLKHATKQSLARKSALRPGDTAE